MTAGAGIRRLKKSVVPGRGPTVVRTGKLLRELARSVRARVEQCLLDRCWSSLLTCPGDGAVVMLPCVRAAERGLVRVSGFGGSGSSFGRVAGPVWIPARLRGPLARWFQKERHASLQFVGDSQALPLSKDVLFALGSPIVGRATCARVRDVRGWPGNAMRATLALSSTAILVLAVGHA